MAKFNIKDPDELKAEEVEANKKKKEEEAAAKLAAENKDNEKKEVKPVVKGVKRGWQNKVSDKEQA